jgi:outer membrane protein assembly factor BamB
MSAAEAHLTKMKKIIYSFVISFIMLLFNSCSDPVSPVEEYLQKLWEVPVDTGAAASGFTISNNYIFFISQINPTGKLIKLGKDGKSILKYQTGGCSYGVPKVQDGVVYSNNCAGTVFAFNEYDLSLKWSLPYFQHIPLVSADENVLIVTDLNKVLSLNKSDGSLIWSVDIKGRVRTNPVIEEDKIYLTCGQWFMDGYLYCLNKYDGSVIYKFTIPYLPENSQEGGSRAGVEIWNDRLYVSGDNRYFYCFEKQTGNLIWSFLSDAIIEVTPVISEGYVYFGTLNKTCYALDAITGQKIWSYQGRTGSIIDIASFYKNYVIFPSGGAIVVLDKYSGKEFFILKESTTEYGFSNAICDIDGKIYTSAYNESGQYYLVAYQFK